jgi:membrane-associated protease RseP (regulator of RpoE activity)
VLTFLSTTLVGSNLMQITVLPALFDSDYADRLLPEMARAYPDPPAQADSALAWLWRVTREGLTYSVPLMTILLCHEMGHYLMAVRHRVPASFPYFIPMPIPPLGTMGAVIFQGRGVANRRQMFDIAVAGPLAGLVVTLPVLYYGITQAHFDDIPENGPGMRFGDPLLVRWLVEHVLGPIPEGQDTILNGYLFAGWVGVFITALNLMPIGQLDGGHILYTLIGRRAHKVALAVLFGGIAAMIYSGVFSYALLLFLLMLMGVKHPPTANDQISLGPGRHVLGWATLAFLVIGFTPQPIILSDGPPEQPEQRQFDPERRIDLEDVDPNQLVQLNSERGGDAEQNRLFRPC